MYVAVIRGDTPGPLFIADVETVSQPNYPIEPPGQAGYISVPQVLTIQAYLNAQGLVATASTLITATVPIGGPVNVSSAAITAVSGLSGATVAQVAALQGMLATHFIETETVIQSFQVGNLSKYLESTWTPDSRRLPAFTPGAAIACVMDDGHTTYTAPLPSVTGLAISGGNVTITGVGLGNPEFNNTTRVKFTGTSTLTFEQKGIVHLGGAVSATSIVIPQSAIPGIATGQGSTVQVKFTSLASNAFSF